MDSEAFRDPDSEPDGTVRGSGVDATDWFRRHRLLAGYLAFVMLLIGGVGGYALADARSERVRLEQRFLQGAADLFEQRMETWIREQRRWARLSALAVSSALGEPGVRASSDGRLPDLLARASSHFPDRDFIYVPETASPVVGTGGSSAVISPRLRSRIDSGDLPALGWRLDGRRLEFLFAVPVLTPPDAADRGALVAVIDPRATLYGQFVRWSNMETTEASLVLPGDEDFTVATLRGNGTVTVRAGVSPTTAPPTWIEPTPETMEYHSADGEALLGLSRRLDDTEYRIAVEVGPHEVMQAHRQRVAIASGFAAAVALLVGFVVLVVRREVELEALRRAVAAERRLSTVLDGVGEAIILTDAGGRISRANAAAERLLGASDGELVGERLESLLDGVEASAGILDGMGGQSLLGVEEPLEHRRGDTVVPLEGTVTEVAIGDDTVRTYVLRDVSHRLELEAARREASRLASLRYLTGGIAHDFNNLLGAISMSAELLMETVESDDGRAEIEVIREATERAANLTDQLLAFGGRVVLRLRRIDLNALLRKMEEDLRHGAPEGIVVVLELEASLPELEADPERVQQILRELMTNSFEAMPEGGTVRVRTAARRGPTGGRTVCLEVVDDGSGMDADVREHAKEPFFTTKEFASRAGLGLSTVHGLMRQMGGGLQIRSVPGEGTTVTLSFPIREQEAPPLRGPRGPVRPANEQGPLVLVADDEVFIRSLVGRALRKSGYRVVEAKDGQEALEKLDSAAEPVHLLVTDLLMPRVEGPELAAAFRRRQPGAPILFISGYADRATGEGLEGPEAAFLCKPFRVEELLETVEKLLSESLP